MENLKKNLQMFDFKENQPVVITTCYSEDFGYSYNDEILKYLRMDEKIFISLLQKILLILRIWKNYTNLKTKLLELKKYIKTIEDASNFINDINSIENYRTTRENKFLLQI